MWGNEEATALSGTRIPSNVAEIADPTRCEHECPNTMGKSPVMHAYHVLLFSIVQSWIKLAFQHLQVTFRSYGVVKEKNVSKLWFGKWLAFKSGRQNLSEELCY